MAQRFGRNKRRRARQELAAQVEAVGRLTEALDMDRALLKDHSQNLAKLLEEIKDAKRIAGWMTVLFPAETMRIAAPARKSIQVMVPEPLIESAFDSDMLGDTVQTMPLCVMLSKIEKNALARAVHVRVEFDNRQWGYGISQDALRAMPVDRLAREVMTHLGMNISHELVQAAERGGWAR